MDQSVEAKRAVESRPTFEEWAFSMVESYAERGTCIRRQAGAIAFDKYNRIVGLGMNGVPRGFPHCTAIPCPGATDPAGDTTHCLAVHAETNMVINSHDTAAIVLIYVSTTPCTRCALMLANLPNLKKVKASSWYADKGGVEILEQAGVIVEVVPNGNRMPIISQSKSGAQL